MPVTPVALGLLSGYLLGKYEQVLSEGYPAKHEDDFVFELCQ